MLDEIEDVNPYADGDREIQAEMQAEEQVEEEQAGEEREEQAEEPNETTGDKGTARNESMAIQKVKASYQFLIGIILMIVMVAGVVWFNHKTEKERKTKEDNKLKKLTETIVKTVKEPPQVPAVVPTKGDNPDSEK